MNNFVVIGGGVAGRFSAYRAMKNGKNVSLVYDEEVGSPSIFDCVGFKGEYGGLKHWGGQVFLDFKHPAFDLYGKEYVLGEVLDFLFRDSDVCETYENLHGFGILLPKNWKPKDSGEQKIIGEVNEIDFSRMDLSLKDGRKLNFNSLHLCTGCQVRYEVKNDNVVEFNPSNLDELYDKRLDFVSMTESINIEGVSLKRCGDFYYHFYSLKPQINYEKWSKELVALMHYKNEQLSFTQLTCKAIFCGFIVLTRKLLLNKRGGYIRSISPINPVNQVFKLRNIKDKKAVALHRNIYQEKSFLDLAVRKGVRGDYFRDQSLPIKSGSVGYRLLNCMLEG